MKNFSRVSYIASTPISILLQISQKNIYHILQMLHKNISHIFLIHSVSISVLLFSEAGVQSSLSLTHSVLDSFFILHYKPSCSEQVVFYSMFTACQPEPCTYGLHTFLPNFLLSFFYVSEFKHVLSPSFLVGNF